MEKIYKTCQLLAIEELAKKTVVKNFKKHYKHIIGRTKINSKIKMNAKKVQTDYIYIQTLSNDLGERSATLYTYF